MITLTFSLAVSAIFASGAIWQAGYPVTGLALAALVAGWSGILVGWLRRSAVS